jgi:hypothetical protein
VTSGASTDPAIARDNTIAQDFLGNDLELTPVASGPDTTVRLQGCATLDPPGEDLEATSAASDPNPTVRQSPISMAHDLLGDALETTPVSRPQPHASTLQYLPGRAIPVQASVPPSAQAFAPLLPAALLRDLEQRVTDPVVVAPILPPALPPAPGDQPSTALARFERRPAPPAPPPAPIVKQPPMLPPALPRAAAPKRPAAVDPAADVPTLPLRSVRASPPAASPPAPRAPELPPPAGPPRPRVDPLRERRMRARLARLSHALMAKVEQKPPVWRVLLLGMAAGLLIAVVLAVFYFRGRDARPDAPAAPEAPEAPTHGPKLKDFGAKPEGSDRSMFESLDDAVEFSKKK